MKQTVISMLLAGIVSLPAIAQSAFEEINANPALSAGKYYATRHQRQNLPQFLRDILHSIFPHLHVTVHDISQRKRNTIAR